MLTLASKMAELDAANIGPSVYAHVDERTLMILDELADEHDLPRSWLISRILRDWAAQHLHEQPKNLAA